MNVTATRAGSVPGFASAMRSWKKPVAPSARIQVFGTVGSVRASYSAAFATPSPSSSAARSDTPNLASQSSIVIGWSVTTVDTSSE